VKTQTQLRPQQPLSSTQFISATQRCDSKRQILFILFHCCALSVRVGSVTSGTRGTRTLSDFSQQSHFMDRKCRRQTTSCDCK